MNRKILFILVLALLLRSFFDTSYFFWDETDYIMNARVITGGFAPVDQWFIRPPLLPILIAPFAYSEVALRIFMVVINLTAIIAIYLLGRQFGKIGEIAAFITAIFPFHILQSRFVMTDSISFSLISFTIAFLIKGIKEDKSSYYLLGGLFFSLSILTKFTNLMILPIIFLLFFFYRPNLKKLFQAVVTAILTFLPFIIWNILEYGELFYVMRRAFHVVDTSMPISLLVISFHIIWFFGGILIFALIEAFKKKNIFLSLWLFYGIAYFILLSQRGIAKPAGIEWEMQRFIFPALAPAILLGALFMKRLKKKIRPIAFLFLIITFIPTYIICYTPQIEFESGLRYVSKDIGQYINNNIEPDATLYVIDNYPVIAYYADRTTRNDLDELEGKIYQVTIDKDDIPKDEIYLVKKGDYVARLTSLS